MNRIIKIAGSAALMAGICVFCLSSAVPAQEYYELHDTSPEIHSVVNTVDTSAKSTSEPASVAQPNVITDTTRLKKNMTIKSDETLYVKKGADLYINEGVKLTLKGKLVVEKGASVYVKGSIVSRKGSSAVVSGKVKIMSTGTYELSGTLTVKQGALIKGNGSIAVKNDFSDIRCIGDVKAKIIPPKPVVKNGVTYVGGILIVNKEYSLPESYGNGIDASAYSAYLRMKQASGYDMSIISGYRSYERQVNTFSYWVSIDGEEKAATYSARPGHSEHQTGLAMDITSLNEEYGRTPEGKWLAEHCHEYGFIVRYPKGKTAITGYVYEPWHIRYLGKSNAKLVHDSGLTLEEFLGVV